MGRAQGGCDTCRMYDKTPWCPAHVVEGIKLRAEFLVSVAGVRGPFS